MRSRDYMACGKVSIVLECPVVSQSGQRESSAKRTKAFDSTSFDSALHRLASSLLATIILSTVAGNNLYCLAESYAVCS